MFLFVVCFDKLACNCIIHTYVVSDSPTNIILTNCYIVAFAKFFAHSLLPVHTVVIDAYPNTATVEQGTTLVLVCGVVGVPASTMLSYQWTCPGSSCDAGAVDPEWAAKVQQGNILVVNMRNDNDTGDYTCTVMDSSTQLASVTHSVTVTSELCIVPWAMSRENSKLN